MAGLVLLLLYMSKNLLSYNCFCLAINFDNSPAEYCFLTRGLIYSPAEYQLSLGDLIDSELLVVNLNNYYKCNLNYLTSINKKSSVDIIYNTMSFRHFYLWLRQSWGKTKTKIKRMTRTAKAESYCTYQVSIK